LPQVVVVQGVCGFGASVPKTDALSNCATGAKYSVPRTYSGTPNCEKYRRQPLRQPQDRVECLVLIDGIRTLS
jgi:hypothetical protein